MRRRGFSFSIFDIGTCSLHTVHGSVFDKYNMKIKEPLKGGVQLFHYSPTSRENYGSVSRSTKFLLYYWVYGWDVAKFNKVGKLLDFTS